MIAPRLCIAVAVSMSIGCGIVDGYHRNTAQTEVEAILVVAERYQNEHNRCPTIRSLEYDGALVDPWDEQYFIVCPRYGQLDPMVVQSRGPDGESDTLDDIYAAGSALLEPDTEATDAESANPNRRVFDDGRYAINFPAELELESRTTDGATRFEGSATHDGKSYALIFFVYDAPSAEIADPDFQSFATRRFIQSQQGSEERIEEMRLDGDRFAFSSRFVSTPAEREVHHELVTFVADRTMFFLHIVIANRFTNEARALAQSFEVLGPREDVAPTPEDDATTDPMEVLRDLLPEAPRASAEDRADAPGSTEP